MKKIILTLAVFGLLVSSCQKDEGSIDTLQVQQVEDELIHTYAPSKSSKHGYDASGLNQDALDLIDGFQVTGWHFYRYSQYRQQPGLLYLDFANDDRPFNGGQNVIRVNLYDDTHGEFVSIGQTVTGTNGGPWVAVTGGDISSEVEVGDKLRVGGNEYTISVVKYFPSGDFTSFQAEEGFFTYGQGDDIAVQRDGWKNNMVRVFRKGKVITTYRASENPNSHASWQTYIGQGMYWGTQDMAARPDSWEAIDAPAHIEAYSVYGGVVHITVDYVGGEYRSGVWVTDSNYPTSHDVFGKAIKYNRSTSINQVLIAAKDYLEEHGVNIIQDHDDNITLEDWLGYTDYVEINHSDLTSGPYAGWQRKSYANWDQYDLGYHLRIYTKEGETSFAIAYKDFQPLGEAVYGDDIAELFIDAYDIILNDL